MRLSTKGRYGIRAVSELVAAYGGNPVSIKTIAQRQHISVSYLEQLLAQLRKSGILRSIRGRHGGYVLAAPPQQISLGDVLRALEGPVVLTECVDSSTVRLRSCEHFDTCITRAFWENLGQRIGNLLNEITLDHLIQAAPEGLDDLS